MSTQRIPIDSVSFEPLIYPREIKESYNGEPFWYHVDRYHKSMEVGHVLPPIVVARLEDKNILIDGYHRKLAHERMGHTDIEAQFIDVKDWNEAFLESVRRNCIHGAPLGKMEMVRAAERLMSDNGYPQEEICYAVGIPPIELGRQIEQRLYVSPTTGEKIILKRPVVSVKDSILPQFNGMAQSPFSTEFQSSLIDQLNVLFENHLIDTAKQSVRDGLNTLDKHIQRLKRGP